MILPDKVYDILKWLDLVIIPAAATFYRAAGAVWGWPLGDEIAATAAAVCTLLGAVIGVSTAEFNKER
ncbi:MAG: phage holin [Eubacteriales bacterium]|nr:phage holin [Eubacteriales bacterium]